MLLAFLLLIPLAYAQSVQNLVYDSTQNDVKLTYDDLNRIKHKNSSSDIVNYSYDAQLQGTLSNITFGNSTFKYSYDDRLRIVEEKRIIDGTEFKRAYVYDSKDRLVSVIFSTGTDVDFYYSPQDKVQKIRGYVNDSKYDAFGNPLNRTYASGKVTWYEYYPDTARLRQIKTNSIQKLNYTYDNVGNVRTINDSVNNRSYAMDYDKLDRLTNVTINKFTWHYSYNSIGNVLKIVRNYTETTSFKYNGYPTHAPLKVITGSSGVDLYRQTLYNNSNKTKVLEFYVVNEKNFSIINANWSVEHGDGTLTKSNAPFNLSMKNYTLVRLEHNYSRGGSYNVNVTAAHSNSSDYEASKLSFGTVATGMSIVKQNATLVVSEFVTQNGIGNASLQWKWNCSNGVHSTIPFNVSAMQSVFVVMEHNFTLSNGRNLSCTMNSTDGNQSKAMSFLFDGIKIEGYNSSAIDRDTMQVKFTIRNYYSTLTVNWNVTANGLRYNATGITLNQGEATTITQELNFTNAGTKQIKVTIGAGNFTDTYSENVRLYALGIQDFLNYVKNGTTRVLSFFVRNDWSRLTALWNFTSPAVGNRVNLTANESLIVVIEENYAQGNKDVAVSAYNGTFFEDRELESFRIRHVGIERFETAYENASRAVLSALVVNNVNPLNLSWRLDNAQYNATSSQSLELNTSERAFVVIESNFSSQGVYPLLFLVNSSSYNDNQTGVAVS